MPTDGVTTTEPGENQPLKYSHRHLVIEQSDLGCGVSTDYGSMRSERQNATEDKGDEGDEDA